MEAFAITMNRSRLVLSATAALLLGMTACNSGNAVQHSDASDAPSSGAHVANESAESKMKITIGSKTFTAALEDNPAVAKLKQLLPMTLEMTELNGNEKYHHLSTRLPTNSMNPGMIQNGDIMLYGDNSLVLFYKTFKTSYTYTPLGRIDDPSGLAAAVGKGDVTVSFDLE